MPSLTAAEYPNLGYIVLRGRQDDAAFMSAVASVLGCALPTRPRALVRCSAGVVLWQSPDEWWLACARIDRGAVVHALEATLQGCFAQVVDTSGGLTSLHVAGRDWLPLLRHLASYDFGSLAEGDCVSTAVGKASFTVLRTPGEGVTLVFRRSFAPYIWQLVDRAAIPYGLRRVDAHEAPDGVLSPLLHPVAAWKSPEAHAKVVTA